MNADDLALLAKHNACADAVEWAHTCPDLQAAWDACGRADWMLWLLWRLHGNAPACVHAACDCAATAPYASAGDPPPTAAIQAARDYVDGKITQTECRAAAAAAYAAYAAAYDAATRLEIQKRAVECMRRMIAVTEAAAKAA